MAERALVQLHLRSQPRASPAWDVEGHLQDREEASIAGAFDAAGARITAVKKAASPSNMFCHQRTSQTFCKHLTQLLHP